MWISVEESYYNFSVTLNVDPLIDLNVINPDNYSNIPLGSILKFYQSKHPQKLIIGLISINSFRNKFEVLKSMLPKM